MLDFYLELGAAAHTISRMTVTRDDIQVVLYRGQIRVGSADEHHEDLEIRAGTQGVELQADNWYRAAEMLSRFPIREREAVT